VSHNHAILQIKRHQREKAKKKQSTNMGIDEGPVDGESWSVVVERDRSAMAYGSAKGKQDQWQQHLFGPQRRRQQK
jgi:hypothetical protein